jgi:hypothetical protein
MLTIRNSQLQALANAFRENSTIEHVQHHFPRHCQALGPAAVRAAVRSIVERAERQGFTTPKDVSRFVDLTFMFGENFHSMGWAAPFFKDDSLPADERMDSIYAAAIDFLREGSGNVHTAG